MRRSDDPAAAAGWHAAGNPGTSAAAMNPAALPLSSRHALVTGAAAGLGYHTALGLAQMGARVLLVDRNVAGGKAAVRGIREAVPGAEVEFQPLDLGSLAAIRAVSAKLCADPRPLDILVNNAGLLPPQRRATTADGFELGFGVSVVGHYALTGLLLSRLLRSAAPRVVTVSSFVHGRGKLDLDDLRLERNYEPNRAYATAKLASLMLALELHRRASAAGSPLISVAAHPGIARTGIGALWHSVPVQSLHDRTGRFLLAFSMRFFGQGPEEGALPIIHAASQPGLEGGTFYGPDGFRQFRGKPRQVEAKAVARDEASCRQLWESLQPLSGVRYDWIGSNAQGSK
jgi:NAD(P)-dependent dehydrogenase (short-subunit alcohol dehydrogenase family)